MAWSWSHTNEAYSNARDNLFELDREKLTILFAEWHAAMDSKGHIDSFHPPFFKSKYEKALRKAKKLPDDVLAGFIWEKAEQWATCDNGGFNAHMCPYGCGCHMVSFDYEGSNEHQQTT